jgi:quercetin dioxygenase-like cupin family protein
VNLDMLIRLGAAACAIAIASVPAHALPADPEAGSPRATAPQDVEWKPDPRAPGVQMAVLAGDPKQAGPYVLRVKMTGGARLPAHRHPDVRYVTVLSGVFHLGFGEDFDPVALKPYPAGSLIVIPANTPHFGWVKDGESITQDNGWGPTGSAPATRR